tara:strand:+ start:18506 stop:20056 length:1551 start_codon:yes stop_codon:yes gene_type:complete
MAQRHIDKKYNLSGPWLKAYNDVADTLGGDGYAYYDIDIRKLVNPDETRGKLYLHFITYVPRAKRAQAGNLIRDAIEKKGLRAEFLRENYQVDITATDGKINKIIRLEIKPEAGGGSGGGARETKRTECAQCLFASYAFNVLGDFIHDENSIDLDGLRSAASWIHIDDTLSELMPDKMSPDWVRSCIRGANILWEKYGGGSTAKGKYHFYRGVGLDGSTTSGNSIAKAYARCNSNEKKFSSEDKWNPADIWMASSDFKPEELHKKTGRSFEITTWQMLNEVLQQHFQDKSLIGISLKKVENPIASLTPINVDKEAQKRDVEKYGFKSIGLIYANMNKKNEDDRYPMDAYIYYGSGTHDRFQARNFGGDTTASWQMELKGAAANMGRLGGGSVETVLDGLNVAFPPSGCMHSSFNNTKIWNDCAKRNSNVGKVCQEIVRLLKKYNADGLKANCTEDEERDYILRISTRSQSYRYSKLLGLYLIDAIERSNVSDSIVRNLYLYAASKSDESCVFMKIQ